MAIISGTTKQISIIKVVLESAHQMVFNDISYIIWRSFFIKIQAYQCSNMISYLLKLAWYLLWQITALLDMSFDHVMKTACAWTITILYKYFCIWELDLRLNNIIYHQFLSIIINHYPLLSLTSVLILIIIVIITELLNHF